ncbi:murein transglycosylase A [Altericista sp. CCNU0014]|uniref:murein transglycosylase A n=1 Tax=Altericista sp. CCNU0014 TaxID=3082949 RepID=UPI0038508A2E
MAKRISRIALTAALWGQAAVAMPLLAAPVPLRPLSSAQMPFQLGPDTQLWQHPSGGKGDRQNLLKAVDRSLRYIDTGAARAAYRNYAVPGITQDRVRRSLLRFRQLLQTSASAKALSEAVQREFAIYQSIGKDGNGTVDFTGYYEATYRASTVPTAEYRYPIYRQPQDFASWPQPHPTRLQLEGADGLQGHRGRLRGQELAWLRDRLEAYLVQVQGSARLTLTNGKIMTVGVASKTNYPYVSIGKELVKAGKVKQEDLSLPFLRQYFQTHPNELDAYIPRNNRFIFFSQTYGAPAMGSLGVPVTPERSIATDKALMPPGALAVLQTRLPYYNGQKTLEFRDATHFALDQDTGGAIKTPGRVDIFMGTGAKAKEKAGVVNTPGQLYYLLLKR